MFFRLAACFCMIFCSNKSFSISTNTVVASVANNLWWSPIGITYRCDQTNAEPSYEGKPISQWLHAKNIFNTNELSLSKLLTLTRVSSDDDSDIVRFDVPINYDALKTNRWSLDLGVVNKEGDFALCDLYDSERSSSGDCLLCWNTSYDGSKKYNLRARLRCGGPKLNWNSITIIGPPLIFISTNDLQFFESSSMFDSTSVPLVAKLIKPMATFKIEITTSDGRHLKTISGSTTNGWINLEWNLIDDKGKKFGGDTVNTEFEVTYPDSKP
jgi:hypothetical protein